ncbi:MAG: FAD-dependent monooxygenase [Actinobacteria bacterium]|nr:FAD-dependent monooxygenase [Actinomycetota bacterium]
MPDAVVIGAGPNGLVAANLLADAGWSRGARSAIASRRRGQEQRARRAGLRQRRDERLLPAGRRVAGGRYCARSSSAAALRSADLSRNRSFCSRFSKRRGRAISVLNHSLALLVRSIGGQRALLPR